MAFSLNKSHFPFLLIFSFSFIPFISSFSTIAISETSNQALICALVNPPKPYLNCTAFFSQGIQIPLNPNISFSGIVAGNGFLCTLRPPSALSIMHCWRFSDSGTITDYKRIYRGPVLSELEAGNSRICGLVEGTNQVECWPRPNSSAYINTNIKFSSLAVGEDFVCGLSQAGEIGCWGGNSSGVVDRRPAGNYSMIAAGFRHACAIRALDNSLDCWGDIVGEIPKGKFTSVALGENRSCAVRIQGIVICWGERNFGLPESLKNIFFTTIEAKRSIFCGVESSNYTLYCWGNDVLDSNFMVFEKNVMPGTCMSECPCGPLQGSGGLCETGSVCDHCVQETPNMDPPFAPEPLAPSPSSHTGSRSSGWSDKMVAFLVVGCVGSLALVLNFCFFIFRYCKGNGCSRVHDSGPLEEARAPPPEAPGSSQRHTLPAAQPLPLPPPPPPQPILEKRLSHLISIGNGGQLEEFPLQVLLDGTNNFSDEHKIGTGSFGSVYHATLQDGRQVAIKRAEISTSSSYAGGTKRQEDKDNAFLNELESLSRLNHKNLVRLLGFCEDCNERVLVFEYMNNGSLHDHLHSLNSSSLLSWPARLQVALDAARGIAYLHEYVVPPIIHRDIKSSNILLDASGIAKVSDFGLSLMGPEDDQSHLSLLAAGTVGYIDPEYYRLQQLTTKSDVYSFGVVLLELLSGCKAIHKNENGVPRNVVDYVAPYIVQDEIHRVLDLKVPPPTPFEIEAVAYVGYIAVDCVTLEGRDRPSMTEIVNALERALAACLMHPTLSRSTTGSST